MSGFERAAPAALAGAAAQASARPPGTLATPLRPAPGRPEDTVVVTGFTETQLAVLRHQIMVFKQVKKGDRFELPGPRGPVLDLARLLPPSMAPPAPAPAAYPSPPPQLVPATQTQPLQGVPRPPAPQPQAAPAPAYGAAASSYAAAAQQPGATPGPDALPRWALRRVQGPLWREAPIGVGAEQLGFDPRRMALEEAVRQVARRSAARTAAVEAALAAPQPPPLADGASPEEEAASTAAASARTRLLIEQRMLRLAGRQTALRAAIVSEQKVINGMSERTYRKNVRLFDKLRVEAARAAARRKAADHDAHLKRVAARRRRMQEEGWAAKQRVDARNKGILRAHERLRREAARTSNDALARRRAHEAMMAQDYTAYLQHVKADGASERYEELAKFLTKTEQYLTTLGSKISSLKATHERQDAAAAAAAAAKARGGSVEEQEAAAAAAERAALMAMDAVPDATGPAAYYTLAHAVGETITRQPEMLRLGQLREYQLVGLQWMISLYNNRLNGILADEMGLGKTVQVMALIAYLWENKGNRGPHLIIVPNAVLVNWRSEMRLWLPSVNAVFYVGHREAREKLFATDVAPLTFNVLVTTYEFIMKDRARLCKIKWRYLIIDEAQRMKDRESKLSRDLDYFDCQNRLLLTGTPLQNDISELWALLNLLLPHVFDSYSAFQSWFSTDGDGDSVADEWLAKEKRVIVISRLHQILEPFMLRRRVEDVESKLPPKVTHVVYAPMPAFQASAYEWVKATGTLRLDPEYLVGAVARAARRAYAPLQNKAMELRKMVNHPCLSYPPERGGEFDGELLVRTCGKLWLLDRMLVKLHASGHRVLLFSTMTKLLDVLERYLEWRNTAGGIKMRHCRIDGTTPLEDRETSIQDFNAPGSDLFIFLLSIRAAGRGLNLQTADTVVVYDPDPNPKNEEQAVARSHRIGQKREVRVFHFEAVANAVEAGADEDDGAAEDEVDEDDEEEQHAGGADGDAAMRPAKPPGPRRDHTGGYRRRQRRATVDSVESLVRNTIQAQKIEMADEVINAGRFDQRTTHEERRATLEELLRDPTREAKASHVVPRLRELNTMMARSSEELRLFEAMDRDPNIHWPTWQTSEAELPDWLRYEPREVVAAQAHVAKPKPGRAGELAAAAAAAAELTAAGTELGRGVRGAANRDTQQARNLAVRLYEQGRLDLDQMHDSAAIAVAAAEAGLSAEMAPAPPQRLAAQPAAAAPPAAKAYSFAVKLKMTAGLGEPADASVAADSGAAGDSAAVDASAMDEDDDVVLAPELREDEEEGLVEPDADENRHDSASEGVPEEDDPAQRPEDSAPPSLPPFDEEDSERPAADADVDDGEAAALLGDDAAEADEDGPTVSKRARYADADAIDE